MMARKSKPAAIFSALADGVNALLAAFGIAKRKTPKERKAKGGGGGRAIKTNREKAKATADRKNGKPPPVKRAASAKSAKGRRGGGKGARPVKARTPITKPTAAKAAGIGAVFGFGGAAAARQGEGPACDCGSEEYGGHHDEACSSLAEEGEQEAELDGELQPADLAGLLSRGGEN